LDINIVEKLIHESPLYQFGISVISGGGEPFTVDESILTRILDASRQENLYTKMTTNAYWAGSYEEAYKRLKPLAENKLRFINISVSESHQEYVKYNKILYATQAAKDLGIDCVLYLTTLNKKTNPINNIINCFQQQGKIPPYICAEYYFIPFGNADINFDLSEFQLTNIDNLRGACPSVGDHVCIHPDGTVTPCAMVFSLYVEALHTGNVYNDSLSDIMERINNNRLVQWLAVHGIVELKDIIEENTDLRFSNKYVNICHLCAELLRNGEVLTFLKHVGLL
jgi:MoaA/NifB/PqqE/SkfB family radical SAM enzyme